MPERHASPAREGRGLLAENDNLLMLEMAYLPQEQLRVFCLRTAPCSAYQTCHRRSAPTACAGLWWLQAAGQ